MCIVEQLPCINVCEMVVAVTMGAAELTNLGVLFGKFHIYHIVFVDAFQVTSSRRVIHSIAYVGFTCRQVWGELSHRTTRQTVLVSAGCCICTAMLFWQGGAARWPSQEISLGIWQRRATKQGQQDHVSHPFAGGNNDACMCCYINNTGLPFLYGGCMQHCWTHII